jgi:3-oxoacyl-[acyl-carrier protein] reductase
VVLSGTREAVLQEVPPSWASAPRWSPANLSDPAAWTPGGPGGGRRAPLDILVANAGITRDGLLLRMKDEDWDTS